MVAGVAVVLGCAAIEIQGDVALLLAIGRNRLDGIDLFAIAEGDLNPEGAVAGEGNLLATNAKAGRGIGGSVDDQLGIGDQPEGALALTDHATAGFIAAAGPEACAGGVEA